LLRSWGEGIFTGAHGICIGPDDLVYLINSEPPAEEHAVYKYSADGKLLLTLGKKDQPSDTGFVRGIDAWVGLASIKRSGPPFNAPNGVALSSSGEIYVCDGYGNARVHKFSPDGKLLLSWGTPGCGPGQFRIPHSIWVDKKDRVWVADRENNRIQIFDAKGKLIGLWTDLIRPTDICIDDEGIVYVSELCLRVSIFSPDGKVITRWGSQGQTKESALFLAPHNIRVDSKGDLYVGEVPSTSKKVERGSRAIQKFRRCR
jgi:sugar lactone lactonase YvrE